MDYISTRFHIIPPEEWACDLLAAIAAEEGYDGFEYTDTGMTGYIATALHSAEADQRIAEALQEAGVAVVCEAAPVPDANWNATWEAEGFPPIVIDDALIVVDERHQPAADVTDHYPLCISIRATQAFGTATHATTQMMLRALLQQRTNGVTVVDCGTGTGILAIAAAKRGAQRVVAYDIDKWSVDSTTYNADHNDVVLDIRHGDIRVVADMDGTADIVLANINRNVLVGDMAAYAAMLKLSGVLLLSGFLADDVPTITASAQQAGLHITQQCENNGWMLLKAEKAGN